MSTAEPNAAASAGASTGYDPKSAEPAIYAMWEKAGAFDATPDPARPPYVIIMPPPNVTGALHLGHAMFTLQDVITRYRRMGGFNALYMPGTDHASIATQAAVEKRLREQQNVTRNELGREGLLKKIWEWTEEYGGRILSQLRRIGCSADWRRTRFTLDDVSTRAVYEVFFRLFKEGLIFRGPRMVNWDTQLQTAVADDEMTYETVKGSLWHIRYPIEGRPEKWRDERIATKQAAEAAKKAAKDDAANGTAGEKDAPPVGDAHATAAGADDGLGRDYLTVATTRPETMLGDTAVAVHPEDERYKHLIGKYVVLPLMNRRIPIIADPILVKKEFGTGCVKVTPAHDPNDYACGNRNGLAFINILTPDGKINDNGRSSAYDYSTMPKADARKKVVADLDALGLLEKVEPYETEVGHSDRSKTPIEPMISEQWFLRTGDDPAPTKGTRVSLAELAMDAVRDGRMAFHPARFAKGYLDWLGEKRDWCISRQLWWGHRIPVWTKRLLAGSWSDGNRDGWTQAETVQSATLGDVVITRSGAWEPLAWDCEAKRFGHGTNHASTEYECFVCLNPDGLKDAKLIADLQRAGFQQDPDVLDTWFSSALWPFSTLGWPHDQDAAAGATEKSAHSSLHGPLAPSQADFDYFFPTGVLCTGRDIISLWVARMAMTSLYFTGRVPFSHVYINPTIQDGQGRRMAKQFGNGVDPTDLIEMYGADAMRFTLTQLAGETQDIRIPVAYSCPHCGALTPQSTAVPKGKFPIDVKTVACSSCKRQFATAWADAKTKQELGVALDTSERFELGRNFCTKLWQASTGFVFPNIAGVEPRRLSPESLEVEDRWILSRLSACIAEVSRRFDAYQFNEAVNTLYNFFWSEYCDWYVELVKPRLSTRTESGENVRKTDDSAQIARQILTWVLDQTLRLLQPITPFVTEKLWQELNRIAPRRGVFKLTDFAQESPLLIRADWPGGVVARAAKAAGGTPTDAKVAGPNVAATLAASHSTRLAQMAVVPTKLFHDADAERELDELQSVIRSLRDIRTRLNSLRAATKQPALRTLPLAIVRTEAAVAGRLTRNLAQLHRLGQLDKLEIGPDQNKPPECFTNLLAGIEVYVPVGGLADLSAERKRLLKEREEVAGHLSRLDAKLSNDGFVAKAPAAVIEQERARLTELRERYAKLDANLAELGA